MADSVDVPRFDTFLQELDKTIVLDMQDRAADWADVGSAMASYIVGDATNNATTLVSAIHLLDHWQGAAADEFKAQCEMVRTFAFQVCANTSLSVGQSLGLDRLPAGVPMQYRGQMTLALDSTVGRVHDILTYINSIAVHARNVWDPWRESMATVMFNMYMKQIGDRMVGDQMWGAANPVGLFAGVVDHLRPLDTESVNVPNFGEYCAGQGGQSATITLTGGDHTWNANFRYTCGSIDIHLSEDFNPFGFNGDTELNGLKGKFKDQTVVSPDNLNNEYYQYLTSTVLPEFQRLYPTVSPPTKADESKLPIGTKDPNVGGGSGFGNGGFSSTPYNPGSPYSPDPYGPGSGAPFDPYSGSGGGPGTGSLAGYDPGSLGSGLYTPGSASGLEGVGAGSGMGPGAGLAGAGVGGGAGATGRAGMPMLPPGTGMGQGGQKQDRQRAAWLPEDEDIWGANTDASGPVL